MISRVGLGVADLGGQQVERNPNDSRVLFNAARVWGFARHGQADVSLVERAQRLDPERFTSPLAVLYSRFLLGQVPDAEMRGEIAGLLASSTDVELIAATAGTMLSQAKALGLAGSGAAVTEDVVREIGRLVARGRELEPESGRWSAGSA